MLVKIPRTSAHGGMPWNLVEVEIVDHCPTCGGPRGGTRWEGLSYDGSRRLKVDCWANACGHVDKYSEVRKEVGLS